MKSKSLAALIVLIGAIAAACTGMSGGGTSGVSKSRVATAGKTLVPDAAWNCGMADGIPMPESGTLLLEAVVKLDNVYDVGRTPYGQRTVAVTQEGTMSGPKHQGERAAGWPGFRARAGQRRAGSRADPGAADQRQPLRDHAQRGTGASGDDVRVVYDFEAPQDGEFAWLNSGKYVGRRSIDAQQRR